MGVVGLLLGDDAGSRAFRWDAAWHGPGSQHFLIFGPPHSRS